MRVPSRWRYSLIMLPKNAIRSPYWAVQSLAVALDKPITHAGIVIANLAPRRRRADGFLALTTGALDLIHATDQSRFVRVQREVRCIIKTIMPCPAQYRRLSKTCSVDLEHFPFSQWPDFSLKAYACVLLLTCQSDRFGN